MWCGWSIHASHELTRCLSPPRLARSRFEPHTLHHSVTTHRAPTQTKESTKSVCFVFLCLPYMHTTQYIHHQESSPPSFTHSRPLAWTQNPILGNHRTLAGGTKGGRGRTPFAHQVGARDQGVRAGLQPTGGARGLPINAHVAGGRRALRRRHGGGGGGGGGDGDRALGQVVVVEVLQLQRVGGAAPPARRGGKRGRVLPPTRRPRRVGGLEVELGRGALPTRPGRVGGRRKGNAGRGHVKLRLGVVPPAAGQAHQPPACCGVGAGPPGEVVGNGDQGAPNQKEAEDATQRVRHTARKDSPARVVLLAVTVHVGKVVLGQQPVRRGLDGVGGGRGLLSPLVIPFLLPSPPPRRRPPLVGWPRPPAWPSALGCRPLPRDPCRCSGCSQGWGWQSRGSFHSGC